MGKYFALLLGAVIVMMLSAISGTYLVAADTIGDADRKATEAAVSAVVTKLNVHLKTIESVLDNMAQDPHLIAAVQNRDAAQINATLAFFEPLLPGVMKLRVFLPGQAAPDDSTTPKMGFADADMVNDTFTGDQPPMVQGENADRHLAVTRAVKSQDQTIAVLLASMKYDFLRSVLANKGERQPLIELQQDGVVLASGGEAALKELGGGLALRIPQTLWILKYWPPADIQFSDIGILAMVVVVPLLLTVLIFYFGYRRFESLLRDDQNTLVRFIKDLVSGKVQSAYQLHIDELRMVILATMQHKRIVDNENFLMDANVSMLDDEDSLFSGESMDVDGLFSTESAPLPAAKGISVKMPDADDSLGFGSAPLIEPAPPAVAPTVAERTPAPAVFSLDELKSEKKSTPFDDIFRAYDIRGPAGGILNKEMGYDLGRAFGSEAKERGCNIVILGRDGRNSSPGLSEAVSKGIMSTGLNVLDIGQVPTPVVYFIAHHHPGQCGVMITGSHHEPDYNGLKMVINDEVLADEGVLDLKRRIEKQSFATGEAGSKETNTLFVNEYIGMISEDVHLGRPMKVVIDCANGVAGSLAPVLLKTLGCEVIELFCDVDGSFPHHLPDPSVPANLADLKAAVLHYEAELGIAFDGDGDRLGVIDSKGKMIYADRQMMLYAKDVLAANRGAEIIFDVKCSRNLAERIKKYGGKPLMWKTGRPYIRSKVKETGAKLAGEMSGSFFFNDRWFGFDDALYASARLIEILSADNRPSAEVFADFSEWDWNSTPEMVIDMPESKKGQFVESLIAAANFSGATVSTIDGLRADYSDGWGLVRASHTRPALIMRFEAENTRAIVRIQTEFRKLMQQIDPDLRLPF